MHYAFCWSKVCSRIIKKPIFYYSNNVSGTLQLINLAIRNNVTKFIFSSSATVYGNGNIMPITEECAIGCTLNPYGTSKYISELMIRDIAKDTVV